MQPIKYFSLQKHNPRDPEEVTEQEAVDPFTYGSPGKRGRESKRGPESTVVLLVVLLSIK